MPQPGFQAAAGRRSAPRRAPLGRGRALRLLGVLAQLIVAAAAAGSPSADRNPRESVIASLVRLPPRHASRPLLPAVLLTMTTSRHSELARLVAPSLLRASWYHAEALKDGGVGEEGSKLISAVRRGAGDGSEIEHRRRALVVVDPLAIPAMVGLAPSPMPVQGFFEWHLALPADHPAAKVRDTLGMARSLGVWECDPHGHMEIVGLNSKGERSEEIERAGLGFVLLSGLRSLVDQAVRGKVHTLLVQTSEGVLSRHYQLEYGLTPFAGIADGTGRVPDPRRLLGEPSERLLNSIIMSIPTREFLESLDDRLVRAQGLVRDGQIQFVRNLSIDELARLFRQELTIDELSRPLR